jgi:UDP-2,3-diacylglucosamine pyrophosphatase LpxH
MHDAIILSDLHLGSDNCQAEQIVELLQSIHHERLRTRRLILNGDVFDSIDFRRLSKAHWKVLSLIRKLAGKIDVHWIVGNHDGSPEFISHLLGVEVVDQLILLSGEKRVLFMHGHQFDAFIERYPITTWCADQLYRWLQWIDRSHRFAKFAKRNSKIFLRCTEKIESGSVAYANRKSCQVVCCGHTHHSVERIRDGIEYYNSGCWTEKPCHYLSLSHGQITIHSYITETQMVDVTGFDESGTIGRLASMNLQAMTPTK